MPCLLASHICIPDTFSRRKKSGFKIVGYAAAASGTLQIPAVSLAMK